MRTTCSHKNSTTPLIVSYRTLEHSSIPSGLYAGISPLPERTEKHAAMEHSVESLSGRELLKMLISDVYGEGEQSYKALKYEKPSAKLSGSVISVSFSHTAKSVSGIVSKEWVVGVDMESDSRTVSERLAKRMKHADESFKLYENNPIIRVWTMKEAALKAIGTGLRKPMNSVRIKPVKKHHFSVLFDNEIKAEIASFQKWDQWISICYIRPESTKTILSDEYVPIQTGRD